MKLHCSTIRNRQLVKATSMLASDWLLRLTNTDTVNVTESTWQSFAYEVELTYQAAPTLHVLLGNKPSHLFIGCYGWLSDTVPRNVFLKV